MWNLVLHNEGHRLRIYENVVLREIFGPKKTKGTREYRRLHDEELHDQYSSPAIIRVVRMIRMGLTRHVARIVERCI